MVMKCDNAYNGRQRNEIRETGLALILMVLLALTLL